MIWKHCIRITRLVSLHLIHLPTSLLSNKARDATRIDNRCCFQSVLVKQKLQTESKKKQQTLLYQSVGRTASNLNWICTRTLPDEDQKLHRRIKKCPQIHDQRAKTEEKNLRPPRTPRGGHSYRNTVHTNAPFLSLAISSNIRFPTLNEWPNRPCHRPHNHRRHSLSQTYLCNSGIDTLSLPLDTFASRIIEILQFVFFSSRLEGVSCVL